MKATLAKEHKDYFYTHQMLECEDLLTPEQMDGAAAAIDQILIKRLGVSSYSPEEAFVIGRDLWRDSIVVKKIVKHASFANIAIDLMQQKNLRIGYDQYFFSGAIPEFLNQNAYKNFLNHNSSLEDRTCIQGIVCGLMLCIKGDYCSNADERKTDNKDVFPTKAGQGIFFSSKLPFSFNSLTKRFGQHFLLITYALPNAVYIFQEKDPHLHALKKIGYSFGDKLSDKLHPVYRGGMLWS